MSLTLSGYFFANMWCLSVLSCAELIDKCMLNGLEPIALQPGYNWNNTTIKEIHSGACVRAQIYRRHHFWPFHHLLRAHDVLLSQIVLQRSRADVCICL